jgi:hypothetical protein
MSDSAAVAPGPVLRLPPLTVRTDAAEVAAFRAETGGAPGTVPFTFPMRWLAAPEIATALGGLLEAGHVLVHEAQSFAYDAPLDIGRSYLLRVEAESGLAPPRLTLRGQVTSLDGTSLDGTPPDGKPCLRLETVLRIVPAPAAAVAP